MKLTRFLLILGTLSSILIGSVIIANANKVPMPWHTNTSGHEHELTAYMSPDCGCCPFHTDYLVREGYRAEKVRTPDIDDIKQRYSVPESLFSCHTTVVNAGQYFVEGHVPKEAIDRLLEEEPDIRGIGMAGMPAGSPGMGGSKSEPFEVMQVNHDGTISLYMSI